MTLHTATADTVSAKGIPASVKIGFVPKYPSAHAPPMTNRTAGTAIIHPICPAAPRTSNHDSRLVGGRSRFATTEEFHCGVFWSSTTAVYSLGIAHQPVGAAGIGYAVIVTVAATPS